jgi:outer membrane protein OmpA-like peptidoglycan-associated protein
VKAIIGGDGKLRVPRLSTGKIITITPSPAHIRQVRLLGFHFDTDKSFILPEGLKNIRRVREVYNEFPCGEMLVVGHTDTAGKKSYNLTLSLERAKSVVAYLQDDFDTWLEFYQHDTQSRRWGRREDELMLATLPFSQSPYLSEGAVFSTAVKKFQSDVGLTVDGDCGSQTRRALVTEYMKCDGTTLPSDITVIPHGCGEDFPEDDVGDETASAKNRRVDIFMFPDFIVPKPEKETSTKSDNLYTLWLKLVDETIDLTDKFPEVVKVRLFDKTGKAMGNAPFRAKFGNQPVQEGITDGSGFAEVTPPAICPEFLHIVWGIQVENGIFEFSRSIFVECEGGSAEEQAAVKLQNLGYPSADDLSLAVFLFQRDHNVDCNPDPAGLVNDKIPSATAQKVNDEYQKHVGN